ncbi:hypothetical protein OG840_20045 [Streptomyces sp. NBC_01764]|uniref:hypothetical protein n=1 Tax=Streptomyces sp. NBC_01764 TaxID=2975935 RepID=UPI00224D28D5|nr:hypothetical protein [Streptomyces sp. NBC_01764]MCX4403979.1 hypothetical protein [Streptomyces sp. NBC_01764]
MKHRTPGILLTALTVLGTLSAAVHDSTALPSRAATAPGTRDAAGTSAPAPAPVAVINGNFSEPAFTADTDTSQVRGWTIRYPYRFSGTVSGHPDKAPAILLRNRTTDDHTVSQRLRGVRAGAEVTVTFDDSFGGSSNCPTEQLTQGQPFTVQGEGGTRQEFRTDPKDRGWHLGRTYTFRASVHEPLLTFASTRSTGSWNCGPLIARVRATDVPPPVDRSVLKERLPEPVAYIGNEAASPKTVADQCATGAQACVFRPDEQYSYRYYDLAGTVGETYINCTRNTVQQDRPVAYGDQTFDSLSQRASIDRLTNPQDNLRQQLTRGTAWRWSSASERKITETVEPGEASWIEAQAARQRTEGWFVSTGDDPDRQYRLHVTLDGPSLSLPDRIYQRTGPMTTAEKQRCRADRPSDTTPNGADTPAGSNNRGT